MNDLRPAEAEHKGIYEAGKRSRQLKSTAWHPVTGGDDWEPPLDDDGESDLLLLSFSNFPVPCIGFYRKDGEGGAFYDEDNDDPLVSLNLIVNAWMPLPKCYREE